MAMDSTHYHHQSYAFEQPKNTIVNFGNGMLGGFALLDDIYTDDELSSVQLGFEICVFDRFAG